MIPPKHHKLEKPMKKPSLPVEAVVIYLFDTPDLTLPLVGQKDDNLIFGFPNGPKGKETLYLVENTNGKLLELLSTTYE